MDKQRFAKLRPYLYHLTDENNIPNIIGTKILFSTKRIVLDSKIENKNQLLRGRRPDHRRVIVDGFEYRIRDQRPISMLALSKCLTHNWLPGDFIEHINKRVFFWCTIDRLSRHFDRYQHERPRILRFNTLDILKLNGDSVEYCRLNSGATRPNSRLGGVAPYRGPDTFLKSNYYNLLPSSVVEVTVVDLCRLPDTCAISNNPSGNWEIIEFS